MQQRKWWWAYFIWVIGDAGVNAYHIYDVIWDEEEKKKMPGLSPRWSHARFLEELVYDFIFPGRSKTKVSFDTDSTSNTSTHASSICSFSVFGQQQNVTKEGLYGLRSSICRSEYLNAVPMIRMTKGTFEGNYFRHRLDGMRHNWIPAKSQTIASIVIIS
jgi:hypothetical protein